MIDTQNIRYARVCGTICKINEPRTRSQLKRMQPACQRTLRAVGDHSEILRLRTGQRPDPLTAQVFTRVPHAGIEISLLGMHGQRSAHAVSASDLREDFFDRRVEGHPYRRVRDGTQTHVDLLAMLFVSLRRKRRGRDYNPHRPMPHDIALHHARRVVCQQGQLPLRIHRRRNLKTQDAQQDIHQSCR
jgi:hypothetical protein